MKRFACYLIAFSAMFVMCFIGLSTAIIFFPLMSAFIFWDINALAYDLGIVFWVMRIFILISTFMGIAFIFSSEGKSLVNDLAE